MPRIMPFLAAAFACILGSAAFAQTALLMFEQPGCVYCAMWNAEVAPEYPITEEGIAAPLQRLQLRDPLPEGITLRSRPVFTPTFVLVENGVELSRIEGYPGEDFFWPMLDQMLEAAAAAN